MISIPHGSHGFDSWVTAPPVPADPYRLVMSSTETLGGDLCSHGRSVGDCGVCLETLRRMSAEVPGLALAYAMLEWWEEWKGERDA